MSKPRDIDEAIKRARMYNTPTYIMLADEVERLREELKATKPAPEWRLKDEPTVQIIGDVYGYDDFIDAVTDAISSAVDE